MMEFQQALVSSAPGESNGDELSEDLVIAKLVKAVPIAWHNTYWDIFHDLKSKFTNDGMVTDEIELIKRKIKGFYDENHDNSYIQDIFIETLIATCEIIIRSRKVAPNERPKTLEHICREVVRHSAPDEATEIIKNRFHTYIASAVIVDD